MTTQDKKEILEISRRSGIDSIDYYYGKALLMIEILWAMYDKYADIFMYKTLK